MDKDEVVVDTNVPDVANGKADHAGLACEAACIQALRQFQAQRRILLDDKSCIIEEYRKRLSHSGQPGVGDAFFKWLWENQANPLHCRVVPVTAHEDRGFVEFPEDPRLAKFDYDDRKFVAVALASETSPKLLNATDTDWWHYHQALEENGVNVIFLCPEHMGTEG